jgi:transposase
VYDPTTGEAWPAPLFVAVLGASSYTYAEATRDQQLEAWIQSHIHALEYFGGVPKLAVPDNPKTAVTRACRYDPDLNPTYQSLPSITAWAWYPPGRTSPATRPRRKVPCK